MYQPTWPTDARGGLLFFSRNPGTQFFEFVALGAEHAPFVEDIADQKSRIRTLLDEYLETTVPTGLLGKALNYMAGQWPKLIRYVENPAWPVDNNPCENLIRFFCVGRRSWLFSDTVGGAKASANLYSLVQTCAANRVDTYAYLVDLF